MGRLSTELGTLASGAVARGDFEGETFRLETAAVALTQFSWHRWFEAAVVAAPSAPTLAITSWSVTTNSRSPVSASLGTEGAADVSGLPVLPRALTAGARTAAAADLLSDRFLTVVQSLILEPNLSSLQVEGDGIDASKEPNERPETGGGCAGFTRKRVEITTEI